jgi:hypothetical protein
MSSVSSFFATSILTISSNAKTASSSEKDIAKDTVTKHDVECDLKYSLTDQIPLIEKLSDLYSPELYDGPEIFHEVKIGGSYRSLFSWHYPIDSWSFKATNPRSKTLSFIEKGERQILRKWTIKASIIITLSKMVSYYHLPALLLSLFCAEHTATCLLFFLFTATTRV